MIVSALQQYGVRREAAVACAIVKIASYHMTHVVTLLPALVIMVIAGQTNMFATILSLCFVVCAAVLTAALLGLAGRPGSRGV